MKTIILYRTALLANELAKNYQKSTPEWNLLENLINDFNNGQHYSLGSDIDSYSVINEVDLK